MELSDLPNEILQIIVDMLDRRHDLKDACEVSKRFNTLAEPRLYEKINLMAEREVILSQQAMSFAKIDYSKCFVYTTHVDISFNRWRQYRALCPRHATSVTGANQGRQPWVAKLPLFTFLLTFLDKLQDNQLRSFSWSLGSCIPEDILGDQPGGAYLLNRQKLIKTLKLTTNPSCFSGESSSIPVNIDGFKNLHHLSWMGLRMRDRKTLKMAIMHNKEHLESLELDFGAWTSLSDEYGAEIPEDEQTDFNQWRLTADVVGITSKGRVQHSLPRLKHLFLIGMDLWVFKSELAQAFSLNTVRSLKLHHCGDPINLFNISGKEKDPLALKTLEIVAVDEEYDGIPEFLKSFRGLEEMYFHFGDTSVDPGAWLNTFDIGYWQALEQHADTLKRVVYHKRGPFELSDEEYGHKCLKDNWRSLSRLQLRTFLEKANLECFGICDTPSMLKLTLEPIATRLTNLKVLHLRYSSRYPLFDQLDLSELTMAFCPDSSDRKAYSYHLKTFTADNFFYKPFWKSAVRSNPEYLSLANWAFGSTGLPNLKILALGDFSHTGIARGQPTLIVKGSPSIADTRESDLYDNYELLDGGDWSKVPFRFIRRGPELDDEMGSYRSFLEAAPTFPLFPSPDLKRTIGVDPTHVAAEAVHFDGTPYVDDLDVDFDDEEEDWEDGEEEDEEEEDEEEDEEEEDEEEEDEEEDDDDDDDSLPPLVSE